MRGSAQKWKIWVFTQKWKVWGVHSILNIFMRGSAQKWKIWVFTQFWKCFCEGPLKNEKVGCSLKNQSSGGPYRGSAQKWNGRVFTHKWKGGVARIEGPLKNENRGSAQKWKSRVRSIFKKVLQVLACYLKRFIVTPARVSGEDEVEGKVEGEGEGEGWGWTTSTSDGSTLFLDTIFSK